MNVTVVQDSRRTARSDDVHIGGDESQTLGDAFHVL